MGHINFDKLAAQDYLKEIYSSFFLEVKVPSKPKDPSPESIFGVLSSRTYSFLSRQKAEPYKNLIISTIKRIISSKKPLKFYYTLGAGYHAKCLNQDKPNHKVGLGEILCLYQIKRFLDEISCFYDKVEFVVMFDNLCGELANNITREGVLLYQKKFNELVSKLGLEKQVKTVLESDFFSERDFNLEDKAIIPEITAKDYENIHRFLNKACDENEVAYVFARYKQINNISRKLMQSIAIEGVYLMQRNTLDAFCFRSFPGGDQKIQCGEMSLLIENDVVKKPLLITTTNEKDYLLLSEKVSFGSEEIDLLIAKTKKG